MGGNGWTNGGKNRGGGLKYLLKKSQICAYCVNGFILTIFVSCSGGFKSVTKLSDSVGSQCFSQIVYYFEVRLHRVSLVSTTTLLNVTLFILERLTPLNKSSEMSDVINTTMV